jgi:hypothetical protein
VGQLIDKTNRREGIQILGLEWKAFDVCFSCFRRMMRKLQLWEKGLNRPQKDARIWD